MNCSECKHGNKKKCKLFRSEKKRLRSYGGDTKGRFALIISVNITKLGALCPYEEVEDE